MEPDNDILIIEDINKPEQSAENPLQINQYAVASNKKENNYLSTNKHNGESDDDNIINLDSSDEETAVNRHNQKPVSTSHEKGQPIVKSFTNKSCDDPILRSFLQHHYDVVDVDAEDSDPLAPLRSFINVSENKSNQIISSKTIPKQTVKKINTCSDKIKSKIISLSKSRLKLPNTSTVNSSYNQLPTTVATANKALTPLLDKRTVDVSNPQNLTYLGKIIRVPGQPSLIENSSGLIFRTENLSNVVNTESANNGESEMNLYSNFFNNVHEGQDSQSQDIHVNDIFMQNPINNEAASVKIPNSNILDKESKISQLKCTPQHLQKPTNELCMPTLIPYQPQEPNSTVLDLNLNINNPRSATNPVDTISSSQSSLMLPDESAGRYNLALGLVVNVNDPTQLNNPQNQFTNLNNVALDVSFNVNNNGKPATGTNNQIIQSPISLSPTEPGTNRDNQTVVHNTMYCCDKCSFRAVDKHVIQNHVCPVFASSYHRNQRPILSKEMLGGDNQTTTSYKQLRKLYACNLCKFNTLDYDFMKAHKSSHKITDSEIGFAQQCLRSNSVENSIPEKTYCCVVCSFQTTDFNVMKSHVCLSANKALTNENKGLKFMETPAQKSSIGTARHLSKVVQKNRIENNIENVSSKKIYCCVACTFQSSDVVVMSLHVCPSVGSPSTNTVKQLENGNLEHMSIITQKSLLESEIHERNSLQKIYQCASCTFQTESSITISSHRCFSARNTQPTRKKGSISKENTGTQKFAREKQINKTASEQFYCCRVCSFKTTRFTVAKSHRCQQSESKNKELPEVPPLVKFNEKNSDVQVARTPDIQDTLNNLDTFLELPVFICELCKESFQRQHLLFQHLRRIHFDVRISTVFGCCQCTYYVENFQVLVGHLERIHRLTAGNAQITYQELYTCNSCGKKMDTFQNLTNHFDYHIEHYPSLLKIAWKSHQQDIPKNVKNLSKFDKYNCILCGKEAEDITTWLTHHCEAINLSKTANDYKCIEQEFNINRKRKNNSQEIELHTSQEHNVLENNPSSTETSKHTSKRKHKESFQDICYHCKKQIVGEALKCNSGCTNLYHLKCVEVYGKSMDPERVNYVPSWFCLECDEDVVPVEVDVKTVTWAMHLADNAYLIEVEKQKSMTDELKKIKSEKVTMREEFQRIKKFILGCKSERINNCAVKSVCAIVESFLNAGTDST